MAENAKLLIEMILDDKEAMSRLSSSLGKMERETKSATNSMSNNFAKVVAGITATVIAAEGMRRLVAEAIKQSSEQEDAVNRLNVALKNQGTFTVGLSENYQQMAESIQRSSRFSDDSILAMQQTLVSIGNVGPAQMEKVTRATVDLAASQKIDLAQAGLIVAKAMDGNVVALQKLGIKLDENTPKALKHAEALRLLGEKFSGSAAADINTFSGAISQLKNSWDDVLKKLGNFITTSDTVIESIHKISNALDSLDFKKMDDELNSFFDRAENRGQTGGLVQAVGTNLQTIMDSMKNNFSALQSGGAAGIGGVLNQMIFGSDTPDDFQQKVSDATAQASQSAVTNFQTAKDGIQPIADSFITSFEEGFGKLNQGSDIFFSEFSKNVGVATKQATVMFSQTMTQILFHQKSVSEAFKQLGMQIVEMFVQMAIQMATQKALALAFNAVLGGASAATGALVAAAWAPAAALVSLATFGTNAAAAAGALTSTIALSRGLAAFASIIPGAAEGGNVTGSGSVLVGERGPEILNLPRGAQVVPLDRNRGGNNFNIVVEMNNPVISSNQIADDFAQAIAERVSAFIDNERARL